MHSLLSRGEVRMAPDRAQLMREQITKISLVFQMLARSGGLGRQQIRIVQLGMSAAVKLTRLILDQGEAPRSRESTI
jgi:hypothetical protein